MATSPLVTPVLQRNVVDKVGPVERLVMSESFVDKRPSWLMKPGEGFLAKLVGHTEFHVPSGTLTGYTMIPAMAKDREMMAELGSAAKTYLAHVYLLMKRQQEGQRGTLLVNGGANVFYVRDNVAVSVSYHGPQHGWSVNGYGTDSPHNLDRGLQVFSFVPDR